MVPRLKYDVIHSIRVAFLNDHNPARSARVAREYLARLPRGTSRGPEPTSIAPWVKRVDGPSLAATYEVGNDGSNFASKGRTWVVYDHDTTMRLAAAWSGEGFIDWNFHKKTLKKTAPATDKFARSPIISVGLLRYPSALIMG
jgi:hypothetical protein